MAEIDEPHRPSPESVPMRVRAGRLTGAPLRRLLAIPAVALALYAEQVVVAARTGGLAAPPSLAWLLFGASAVLFAGAGWPLPQLRPGVPPLVLAAWRTPRLRMRFFLPLAGAIVCGLAAVPLFITINAGPEGGKPPEPANTGAWLLWIAALLLFGLAFVGWEYTAPAPAEGSRPDPAPDRLPADVEWPVLALLFGLALVWRLPNLESVPPGLWFDEAQNGIVAQQLLAPGGAHPAFIAGFTQMGTLYFYFLGLVLKLFGATVWPLRLLPALSGAAVAPLLYLLAARLYGWRAGLAAGGLLAVSAWNITFSRFGMDSMPTVALDVAVYLCAAQALRTGRLGYFAGAGVLLGLALQMYYPSRLLPIVLIVVLVQQLVSQRMRMVRALRAGVVVFALGAVLAFLPVGLFAAQQPAAWSGRVSDVSVFNPAVNGGNPQAFNQNLTTHLLMFNYHGDANGRHNLPGAPMLDDVTAALFFLGLGVCLLRFWRWQYFFPVVWFAAALSGGVLSLPFEAPQSHRTLENSVVTALLAGIVLGELWQLLTRARAGGGAAWRLIGWALSIGGVLAVVTWAASSSLPRYFVAQAQSAGVWGDMYSAQAETGRLIQQGRDHDDIYVSALYLGLPPLNYLAPGANPQQWPGMQAIPFTTAARDALLLLAPSDAADIAAIAAIYPHATIDPFHPPSDATPLMYTVRIPLADIMGAHGVHAGLTDAGARTPREERTLPDLTFDWGTANGRAGTVRLATTLHVDQSATYSFALHSAGTLGPDSLRVDGYVVTPGSSMLLGSGLHSIVATDTVQSATGTTRVLWGVAGAPTQPLPASGLFDPRRIEPHGLTGLYRHGVTPSGTPQLAHVDPVISFYFQITPLDRPYNVEWTGRLYIPQTGPYGITTEQISESHLTVDSKEVLANTTDNTGMNTTLTLTAGWHDLRLFYIDRANYSHIYLYWTPPGQDRSIIPSAFLWPQLGQYPSLPESGKWPTLAEAQGTRLPAGRSSASAAGPTPLPVPATVATAGAAPTSPPTAPPAPTSAGTALRPDLLLGSARDILDHPRAAAADSAGNLYIFTETDSKVHKYDPAGKPLATWTVADVAGRPLTEGSALLVQNNQLLILDAAGSDLLAYDLDGKAAGHAHLCDCFYPRGLAPARDGNFWIADTGSNRVVKVGPSGGIMQTLGTKGTDPGQFAEPGGVWESAQGVLYVADVANGRVQSFNPDGTPLAAWAVGPSVARDGNRVITDSAGNVLVTEAAPPALVRYDAHGKELGRWVYQQNGAALTPQGLALAGGDKVVVLFLNGGLGAVFTPGK